MRLWMSGSRFGGAVNESDQVVCQFIEYGHHLTTRRQGDKEPARQAAFQMRKSISPVQLVADGNLVDCRGLQHRQSVQIIGQHLGPEILLRSQPGQARSVLQRHAMFQPLERLLDAPAAVVQGSEAVRRISGGVQQRRDHRMHAAVGGHHANQSHLGRCRRAFVVDAVPLVGCAQRHHGFRQIGTQEGLDRRETGIVGAHAERDSLLGQIGKQPSRRITAIQDQQIARSQAFQMLEQHLPLAGRRRVQLRRQGHFQARQIQREGDGFSDPATGGILKEQLQLGRIGGHHAQALPERDGQAFMDECQQTRVERGEGQVGKVLSCLGKGLSADLPKQVCLVCQMREEGIELVLDTGLEAGQHRHDHNGKGQNALAKKPVGFKARLSKQFVRIEVVDKLDKNALVLRSTC
jgi:hypothetical protein